MVKSVLSYHNQESYYMPLMMLTTMESLLLPQPTTAKELFQAVWKEKLESGELVNRLR